MRKLEIEEMMEVEGGDAMTYLCFVGVGMLIAGSGGWLLAGAMTMAAFCGASIPSVG